MAFKLAIIDGTGAFSNAEYERDMSNSFCSQLSSQLGGPDGPQVHYRRGPSTDGFMTGQKGREAAEILRRARAADPKIQIFLAGYSRGASAAIIAADSLNASSVSVDALFLFDPVARHMTIGGEVIPANVKHAYVANRSLAADIVSKYEGTLSAGGSPEPDKIGKFNIRNAATLRHPGSLASYYTAGNPIRPWFGRTGDKIAGSPLGPDRRPRLTVETFTGSHGALGGVGWRMMWADCDQKCQTDVADYMEKALRREGIPAKLTSISPTS